MARGRVQALRYAYPGEGVAGVSADSYEGAQPPRAHWMARLPLVGGALPFLPLTACGLGSSCSSEAKVSAGVALVAGAAALFHFLSRSINNRRIAGLSSPLQMMKYGFPRVRFPRKLDSAEKVVAHYMNKGFPKEAAKRVAYAWHFRGSVYSEGVGDLSQYHLQGGDLHGITSAFAELADYSFDSDLLDEVDRVGCSTPMGKMLNALDGGIQTVPELVNIIFALNLKRYHSRIGSHEGVAGVMNYILSKFSSGSEVKYEVGEAAVAELFKSSRSNNKSDKKIADGVAHFLFGGMALDVFEAGRFDGGLELGFAHIWSARRLFENSSALQNPSSRARKSISTVTNGYSYALSGRALDLWKTSFPDRQHPKTPWSSSMIPATTKMLQSFSVKPV